MTKYSVLILLAIVATTVFAADEALVQDLVKRGKAVLTKAQTELKMLQDKKSYFVEPVQADILKLEKFITEVEKLAKDATITQAQLGLFEARLLKYENDLLTLLLIESEAVKDATFGALVQGVDKLLTQAYADLGKLVATHGPDHRLIGALRAEILAVKESEDEIKRLNSANRDNEKTIVAVERLLNHERALQNLIFEAEHEDLLHPKA